MIRAGIRRAFRLPLGGRHRWEREVEDEIKLHLALRAEQLVAQGATPDEAYDEAVRKFGPLVESRTRLLDAAQHREERMQRTEYLSDLRHDLSFALRALSRQKAWTAVTIATFALGIGATTAVFSVVSTLLLHPLPYPRSERIVYINQTPSNGNNTGISVSIAPAAEVVRGWMKNSRSFEAIEGDQLSVRSLKTSADDPSKVMVESAFPTFPAFAGVKPVIGRMFTQRDIENGGRVVALSESFWRNRLSADRDVLGKTLTLDDSSFMVVGVMPSTMETPRGGRSTDLWSPIDVRDDKQGMSLIGRLRPGVTARVAERELDSIFARTAGFTSGKVPFKTVITTPAQSVRFRDSLLLLTAAVALVLLVACANVAHLLLARAATRQREMAIRAALGAGRSRLLRQLLAESALLSLVGAACGVVCGWAGLRAMIALRPRSLDSLALAHLDTTTLAIAIGAAVASGVVFAVMGALQSARSSTHDSLKSGSPSTAGIRRPGRGRGILVVSEMALSGMLLVGATLLVRSVANMQRANLGYEPRGLYALRVPLSGPAFASDAARAQAVADIVNRMRQLPAVRSVATASVSPGGRQFSIGRLEVQGEPAPPTTSSSFIDVNAVDRSYFATMGMTLRQGGLFSDTTSATHQVIVNEGFARKHWQSSAIGQHIRIDQQSGASPDSTPWMTIVGVTNDAQTSGPMSESSAPVLYTPRNRVSGQQTILVRVSGDAKALAPAMGMLAQMGVKRAPPAESIFETIGRTIAGPRFVMLLLTVFTALALLLAAVGLYGVMSYSVAERTREIGIRVALGASGGRIAKSVIAGGAWLAIVGAVIGVGVAAWGTRLIETQLYGLTRLDPSSYAIGGLILVGAALVACVVPTRRALAVDPMTAIRAD